jgi:type II secretory pathway pseudopilin PulG
LDLQRQQIAQQQQQFERQMSVQQAQQDEQRRIANAAPPPPPNEAASVAAPAVQELGPKPTRAGMGRRSMRTDITGPSGVGAGGLSIPGA